MERRQFPVCESSAPSGRYPKQWDIDIPVWREVLRRDDVDYIDFAMCAWGLGPPDEENAFYIHKTRRVFSQTRAIEEASTAPMPRGWAKPQACRVEGRSARAERPPVYGGRSSCMGVCQGCGRGSAIYTGGQVLTTSSSACRGQESPRGAGGAAEERGRFRG